MTQPIFATYGSSCRARSIQGEAAEIILSKNRVVEMTSGIWRGENFLWVYRPRETLIHVSLKGPDKFRGKLGAAGTEMRKPKGRELWQEDPPRKEAQQAIH